MEGPGVICSALASDANGIGVLQRRLYPMLQSRGLDVKLSSTERRDQNAFWRTTRLLATLMSPFPRHSRFLALTSPLPLRAPRDTVAVVYDLRWLRTRGALARIYRAWDLRRTVKRARAILCISERTRDDLASFIPSSTAKSSVAWLGPGIVPEGSFHPSSNGAVLLIGGAAHKRNEFAARMLVEANPSWLASVEGVGVSSETREILESGLGRDRCRWHYRISDDELVELYRHSEYFVLFGLEEGFGMPYVEALATGCKVVAIDQPLTREILGDAGCLIEEGTPEFMAAQLRTLQAPAVEVRDRQASGFSWSNFADKVAAAVRDLG